MLSAERSDLSFGLIRINPPLSGLYITDGPGTEKDKTMADKLMYILTLR